MEYITDLYPPLNKIIEEYKPHLWDRIADVVPGILEEKDKLYLSFDNYLDDNKSGTLVGWYWMTNINKISKEFIEKHNLEIFEKDEINKVTEIVYPNYEYLVIILYTFYGDDKVYKIYVTEEDEDRVRKYINSLIEMYIESNIAL